MFFGGYVLQYQKKNFYQYGNVMIDIETLSTHTNASILSIAAVEFNKFTGEIGKSFYVNISPSEWTNNGRHIDGNTIQWWLKQDKEARESLLNENNTSDLKTALYNLSKFIDSCDNVLITDGRGNIAKQFKYYEEVYDVPEDDKNNKVIVWGNGSTMDITILQSAYEYFNMPTPWKYWAVNDVRTIVNLNPSIKKNMEFKGVKHHPLADCEHQIKYLTETIKSLKIYDGK